MYFDEDRPSFNIHFATFKVFSLFHVDTLIRGLILDRNTYKMYFNKERRPWKFQSHRTLFSWGQPNFPDFFTVLVTTTLFEVKSLIATYVVYFVEEWPPKSLWVRRPFLEWPTQVRCTRNVWFRLHLSLLSYCRTKYDNHNKETKHLLPTIWLLFIKQRYHIRLHIWIGSSL